MQLTQLHHVVEQNTEWRTETSIHIKSENVAISKQMKWKVYAILPELQRILQQALI